MTLVQSPECKLMPMDTDFMLEVLDVRERVRAQDPVRRFADKSS